MPKFFRHLLNTLALLSLVTFLLICFTILFHDINIDHANFHLRIFGDLHVATGDYIKDPGWEKGRDLHWYTWLDNQARFTTWQEPGESNRRWYLCLPERFLLPATAILPPPSG
jgi:hypothetical protein